MFLQQLIHYKISTNFKCIQLFKDGGPGEIALKRMHDLARLEYIEDRTKAVHEGHLGLQLQGQQGLQAQGQAEAEENAKIQDIGQKYFVLKGLIPSNFCK